MKRSLLHIVKGMGLALMLLLPDFHLSAQNVFASEDDLKKEANRLFEAEDFLKAYPLFSQLLSLYPKDAQYNYKFGTCLLYSTNDKSKAIPYMEYAAKRQKSGVDKEINFYLGKAYHLNYRFADAIRFYTLYKGMASSKLIEKYDVERQIEMCENGKRLLKSVTDLSVLEKKEVPEKDFFRSYNLTEFNAKLILRPDDLKTPLDKKKKEDNVMYLAPNRNEIYYSSFGEDGKTGRDIYMVRRTAAGDLGKPVRLGDVINTKYDEDYAFLHPNGKTLYFCSKGHNSMGGYDIFKSQWNESSQSWGKPSNMDFAINTPDDDILFISDEEDKSAYFSSRRESALGSISVYRIKLDRKPLDLAIITGTLTKDIGDKMPKAKITITKILKDEVIGVYNTNAADGSYTLSLPNGGKFMFTVESAGFKKSSELVVVPNQQEIKPLKQQIALLVVVPNQQEIKPLKQQIALVNEGGQDKIIIKNDFDAQVDSADLALAVQFIRSKASLEVSPAEEEIKSAPVEDTAISPAEIKTENAGTTPVSNSDIIGMAYEDAKESQKDANEARKNSDAAQALSNQKNEQSLQKNREATELANNVESITNQVEKMAQIDKANQLRKEADLLTKEAAFSLNMSNQLNDQAKAKQQQADAELKYAKDLDNAIKAGASEKKMNDLLVQKEILDKRSDSLKTASVVSAGLNKQAEEKQSEASKSTAKYLDIQQDVEDMQSESRRLRAEAEKTKNEGVKQNMIQQADDIDKDIEAKKREADIYNTQAKQLQAQADSLKSSATLSSAVMTQIQSAPSETKTTTPANTAITSTTVTEIQPANTNTVTASATTSTPAETKTETSTDPVTTESPAIKSDYVDVFVNKMHEAEKITKESEKAEALAVIYQQWTDSLENQMISLNKQLASTTNEGQKTEINKKISELSSSVDDKRQLAADNRNKVDNLKLQEALAAASAVSTETTTPAANTTTTTPLETKTEAASTPTTAPENLEGIKNINAYYENKLKEASAATNEYEKKVKEQEAYENWSTALYDESKRLKESGKGGKAEDADKLSREKQITAMLTADKVTEIKAEHPEWVQEYKDKQKEVAASASTAETKSEASVPEISTAATHTLTNTQPIAAETTTPTPTETTSTPVTATADQPATSPAAAASALSTTPPESIRNKDEYTHFVALKNESDWSKKNAERQNQQAIELQKIADGQFEEAQKVAKQSESITDPTEKQKLLDRSADLEKRSLRNQAKADSVKIIAKNSEAESNSKQTESELYLQSLDKSVYEEIAAATGIKPATTESSTTLSAATTPTTTSTASTETKTESTTQPLSTASTPSVTPRESTTVMATYPVATETVSATQPENTSVTTKTESTTQPAVTTSTETKTESSTSPVTATSAVKTETTSTPSTTSAAIPSTNASSAELLKYYDAIFDKLDLAGTTYSASKPIPVDAPMPEGLVFKVQIGAFRNPIAQDLFKGIKPITAETTPQGLKRYTAGLFQKFSTANAAKQQVNGLGYRDAFVVAFFNGKRISMNEALAKAKESGETIEAGAISSITAGSTSASAPLSTSTNISSGNPGTTIANATDVKSVAGLFYTIQIGVFSRPTTSAQLYNIAPLNSERTDNGLIRYTTGRFTSEATAVRAKNAISAKGITDAFVIAYRDGKRISLSAAKTMIDTEGESVVSKEKQEYSFTPSDTTSTESSATSLTTSSNKGVVFKVQVGAYRERVPLSDANKLLKISSKGIKTFTDENGLLIYTVGETYEYETANNLKTQVINEGITGAFVIGFKDGKKISATEALELIKDK